MDNYSPIPVETEDEYKLVVSRFPFHDAELEKVRVQLRGSTGVLLLPVQKEETAADSVVFCL